MAAAISRSTAVRRGALEVRVTRDREMLRDFLEQDRLYAAYAICDLDEREFPKTRWGVAMHRGRPVAVVLEYSGSAPQPVFVMGDPDGVEALLEEVIHPRIAYIAAPSELLPAVEKVYRLDPGGPMVRMWVDRATFIPIQGGDASQGIPKRLHPSDAPDLNRLYDLGFAAWLPADAVARGVYFGIRLNGKLIAAAGTHVISRDARLAVVGNVMTHRDQRGKGFAKQTTAAVTAELLRTSDQVVLNVRGDNPPALAAYRAIGYREHTRFEERIAHRRGTLWDSIVSPFRRWIPAARSPE